VWCWGDFGIEGFVEPCSFQLAGSPEPSPCTPPPPRIIASLPPVVQIVGNETFYGLDTQGRIHQWGRLGNHDVGNALPHRFSKLERVRRLAAGGDGDSQQGCALLQDGTVQCWGKAFASEPHAGADLESMRTRAVVGVHDAVDLDMGEFFACALQRDRSVACWGLNVPGTREDDVPPITERCTARPVKVLQGPRERRDDATDRATRT
jgi:hypothetical protein